MATKKHDLQSLTVWGAIIALLGWIKEKFGVNISESDIETGVNGGIVVVGFILNYIGRKRKGDLWTFNAPKSSGLPALLGLLCLGMIGCTNGGKIDLTDVGVSAAQTGASGSKIHTDGEQSAVTQGESPTLIWLDSEGIKKNTAGTTRTFAINPATGEIFADTSSDLSIQSLEYTPKPKDGEPQLKIGGLSSGMTDLTKAKFLSYDAAMKALEAVSDDRREEVIRAWMAAETITKEVGSLMLKSLVPVP